MAGLEDRAKKGRSVADIASVASFFVSRIDSEIDKKIDARMKDGETGLQNLRGKVAIANAKIAYQHYLDMIAKPRWKKLADSGAQPQRLLWASTGVKDKAYSDVLYVEELIGRDTRQHHPAGDHGRVPRSWAVARELDRGRGRRASGPGRGGRRPGSNLDGVTRGLVTKGVELFAEAARPPARRGGRQRARRCSGPSWSGSTPSCRRRCRRRSRPAPRRGGARASCEAFGPARRRSGPAERRRSGSAGSESSTR